MNQPDSTIQRKWGVDVLGHGFQVLPDLLFKYQAKLGIDEGRSCSVTPTEMVVLLNILSFWWRADRPVFPSASLLAERVGIERRSIDRAVQGLVKKQLLKKTREGHRVLYDPTELPSRLRDLSRADQESNPGTHDSKEAPF
jgi:hypothetical protein